MKANTFTTRKRREYFINWDGKIPASLQLNVYEEKFEKKTEKMEESKKLSSTLIETKKFDFVSITEPELVERRKENLPTMVMKVKDDIYMASIPRTINLLGQGSFVHFCGACVHMSAKKEEEGGCKKVSDRDFPMALKCYSSMQKVLGFSKRLEAYPFIKKGLEAFGTYDSSSKSCTDVFIVLACENFQKICSKKKPRD